MTEPVAIRSHDGIRVHVDDRCEEVTVRLNALACILEARSIKFIRNQDVFEGRTRVPPHVGLEVGTELLFAVGSNGPLRRHKNTSSIPIPSGEINLPSWRRIDDGNKVRF